VGSGSSSDATRGTEDAKPNAPSLRPKSRIVDATDKYVGRAIILTGAKKPKRAPTPVAPQKGASFDPD
jgi:hypothetical protein